MIKNYFKKYMHYWIPYFPNTCIQFIKFLYYKIIMLHLLINFLPHLIYPLLTYKISKRLAPLLILPWPKYGLKEPRVPFFFSCNHLSYLVIVYIITTHFKDFIKKIINSSPPIHSPNGWPLLFL